MSFAHFKLHADILKAITDSGYTTPSPIQAKAIPIICAGKDLIASAQTGTGKTAAFVLPALQYLINNPSKHGKPQILILSPTRELAQQIEASAKKYGKNMRFTALSIVGGMPYRQQFRQLSRPLDMIIATPGRFMDLMERPNSLDLSHIKIFVLDEADRMLDMGFIDDVAHIAKYLEKVSHTEERQTLLFSATLDAKIGKLAKNLLDNPEVVEVTPPKMSHAQIEQRMYIANDTSHKNQLLDHILENESIHQGIIFSATKRHADNFAKHLRERGYKAVAMHGDMKQTQRIRTLEDLRNGKIQFLVATDVAARGIDVQGISHVFNYDLPRTGEDYTHRIGRTGRAGNTGIAITFALTSEARTVQQIERMLGASIPQHIIEGLEPRGGFKHGGGGSTQKRGGAGSGKRKFGTSNGKPSRSGNSRSNDGYSKPAQSRFGQSDRSDRKPRDANSSARPDFARKPRDANSSARPDFARKSRDSNSSGRPDFARKSRDSDSSGRPDFARKPRDSNSSGRPDFARKSRDSDSSTRPEFARKRRDSDAPASGRSRSVNGNSTHFADSGRAKPDYAKKRSSAPSSRFSNDRNASDRTTSTRFSNDRNTSSDRTTSRFEKPDFAKKRRTSDAPSSARPDFARKRRDSDAPASSGRPDFAKKRATTKSADSKPFAEKKKLTLKKKKIEKSDD